MTACRTVAVPSLPGPADAGPGTGGITGGPALTLTWAELHQEISQAERTGLCRHPVRLKGRIDAIDLATGELRPVYDTATEPGGALLTACGNRRETVCPPCSGVYKRDARQLVRAGLTGGKGIPETVAAHPCVFATFTAPSFGPVHARRMRGHTVLPCRPRRDAAPAGCPHGRDISCPVRHHPEDPRLGRPLCGDCYDYTAAVLFNACAADLWRRFTTYLPRRLAALAGMSQRRLRALVRVRYVKVAEYQARGVVHFHAIIRLDRTPVPGRDDAYSPRPRPSPRTCCATRSARPPQRSAITAGPGDGQPARSGCGFGTQTDARPIRHGPGPARHRRQALGPGRGQLHRQVRHQSPRRPRHPRPAPAHPGRPARACAAPATTSR